jgi:hypothetical protein
MCLCRSRAINYAVILNSSPRMLSCVSEYQVVTVVVSCVDNLIWQKLKTVSQLHYALIVLIVEFGTCHLAVDTQAPIIYRLLACINSSILLLKLFYIYKTKHFVYCCWNRVMVLVSAECYYQLQSRSGSHLVNRESSAWCGQHTWWMGQILTRIKNVYRGLNAKSANANEMQWMLFI